MSPERTEPRRRITRDDLEAKFAELAGEVEEGVQATRGALILAAAVGVTVLVVGAYLVGRRRGLRARPVLEIRRL